MAMPASMDQSNRPDVDLADLDVGSSPRAAAGVDKSGSPKRSEASAGPTWIRVKFNQISPVGTGIRQNSVYGRLVIATAGNSTPIATVDSDAMTRRTAIFIGLGFPVGFNANPAWGASGFWNDKKSSDWTEDEIHELLTKSPWAKEPSVSYNSGPGNAGRQTSTAASRGYGRTRVPVAGTVSPGGTSMEKQQYKTVVRWETALPIRLATRKNSGEDPLANYVLNVVGDLPMLGTHKDESETDREQRVEMLKQYTRLERKNDPIYLAKIKFQSATETLFYFDRVEPIFPDDKQVTFVTKLGPLDVKCKFILKEMLYQGKLEL
jgi:hypothetical protein